MRSIRALYPLRVLLYVTVVCIALLSVTATTFSTQVSANTASETLPNTVLPLHPLYNDAKKVGSGLLPCLNRTSLPLCYSPQQIRRAYGIQSLLDDHITGKGRTIVIIDAFQSPNLQSDLRLFDKIFNLPNARLNVLAPFGLRPFNPKDAAAVSFAVEISLDVEWAHAIAPDATIDLVLGNPVSDSVQSQLAALVDATRYAVDNDLGSTISQSFGAGETCFTPSELQMEHQTFQKARDEHISVFASSGDSGSAVIACNSAGNPVALVQGVNYPASDPLVSAVGGTTLFAARSGAYNGETAWNESNVNAGATGGGFSRIFPRPSYQSSVSGIGSHRGVPDIAYVADPLTGVPVVISVLTPSVTLILPVGGTSAGSPQWAAVAALADQAEGQRLGFLNAAFYRIAASASYSRAFRDITTGNNAFTLKDSSGKTITVPGYAAAPGWDPTTGVGSPKVNNLADLLAKYSSSSDGAGL